MAPKDIIEGIYEAFGRGDIPAILSRVAPAAVWRQSPELPWGGDYRGPEGAGEFFSKLNDAMETTAFRADETILIGPEEVISFGYYEGRGRRSGIVAGAPWAFRWRVQGDKLTLVDSYIDSAALLKGI